LIRHAGIVPCFEFSQHEIIMVKSHPAGRSTLRPDYTILERA
jgi:hypothetical protein